MTTPKRERWSREFPRWFDWVLEVAGIYDYGRYPVKGVGVWLPYGFKIRRLVVDLIRSLLDSRGHDEILLPLLIPEELLRRESEHIKGFEGEVFWVTRGGLEELEVKYALRPTSETAISYMESMWVKSYKQLPLKFYQVVNVFRYETKATRPLIRVREVTMFKEAHTVHASFEEADKQVGEAIEIYKEFFDKLGIPYLISKRPEWDKFAGALYTITFDTLMPDGRVLQIASVHHLGQNFTIPFEVRIQYPDESLDYAWQTSYGISERVIAALIAIHGDDRGAVLPPLVAPIQVVIVPIPSSEVSTNDLKNYVNEVKTRLEKLGVRVHVDWREDIRPGRKYYEWEAKGVPLRIEIGGREVKDKLVTIARRDTLTRITVELSELEETVKLLLRDIEDNLKRRAWLWFKNRIKTVERVEEAQKLVEEGNIVEVPWCGRMSCGVKLEEEINANIIGTPLESPEWCRKRKCILCGEPAVTCIRLAKKY